MDVLKSNIEGQCHSIIEILKSFENVFLGRVKKQIFVVESIPHDFTVYFFNREIKCRDNIPELNQTTFTDMMGVKQEPSVSLYCSAQSYNSMRCSSNTLKKHRHLSNFVINGANTISLGSVMYMGTAPLKSPGLQGAQQSNETQHNPPQLPHSVCSLGGGLVVGVYFLSLCERECWGVGETWAVAGRSSRRESFRFCL